MSSTRRRFLRDSALVSSALALLPGEFLPGQSAEVDAHIGIFPQEPIATIEPEIYGHFIEHLGGVIYDGIWVGTGSKVRNIDGIRTAFVDTMKSIKAPVIRWPGGCFADSYDWRDGIGPRAARPQRTAFWSDEDTNAFGLHEFMQTCRLIGAEPYLAADIRTLPARDFYQFIEYCNAPGTPDEVTGKINTLAAQRAKNGSPEPFNVRYWGVGNEVWGCGGSQTAAEYGELYRRFTEWLPRYPHGVHDLRLVACGANGDDARWAGEVVRSIDGHHTPWGMSTHYYTSGDAKKFAAGDALQFDEPTFYDMLARSTVMERVILDSWQSIGETDSNHRIRIVMDEWGSWYSNSTALPHFTLYQQHTMRDALLAGITFDIFHRHAEKVAMANVAQTINALHSLMLAHEDKFLRTPTYDVFRMYMPHMGAQSVRVNFAAPGIPNKRAQVSPVGGNSAVGSIPPANALAGLSGSASVLPGSGGKTVTLTVVNTHLHDALTTEIMVPGASISAARGEVLAETDIHAHNTFDQPDAVRSRPAQTTQPTRGRLLHTFPPACVSALTLTLS